MKKTYTLSVLFFFHSLAFSQNFTLNGVALQTADNCYQMTPAQNGQLASIWNTVQIDLNDPFDMEFNMNFGSNPSGADGMIFVLQTIGDNMLGSSGQQIGYGNSQPGNSFGVEFDTFENPGQGDPFYDHLAFISQGSTSHLDLTSIEPPVQILSNNIDIEDGLDHIVRIQWLPPNVISVDVDCEFRLLSSINLIEDIFDGDSIVYWGFTSSTGGLNNQHTICIPQEQEPLFPDECQEPGLIAMVAGGFDNGSYSWEPANLVNEPGEQAVFANLTETTTFIITNTHPCNTSSSIDTITVFINDIELEVVSNEVNCNSDTLNLIGTSNDNDDVTYNWSSSDGVFLGDTDMPNAIAVGEGTYLFSVTDTISGCTRELSYEAPGDFSAPQITSNVDGLLSCQNPEVELQMIDLLGLGSYTFEWSTNTGNIVSTNDSVAIVDLASSYLGTMTFTETGCADSIWIEANDDPDFLVPLQFVEMPNVITPNNDQVNDHFRAFLSIDPEFDLAGKIGSFDLEIFNRWGNKLHYNNQVARSWDAENETPGTYFYILRYSDLCDRNALIVKKGAFEIIK